ADIAPALEQLWKQKEERIKKVTDVLAHKQKICGDTLVRRVVALGFVIWYRLSGYIDLKWRRLILKDQKLLQRTNLPSGIKADIIVAKDGSGKYENIQCYQGSS
ncbi:hypothetical protein Tco_1285557, partial [Tanacetum coccineum]